MANQLPAHKALKKHSVYNIIRIKLEQFKEDKSNYATGDFLVIFLNLCLSNFLSRS